MPVWRRTTQRWRSDPRPQVSGSTINAIVIVKDTGTEATSPLIAYIDTATGLPITPNGGDIIVTWDNGINKIFRV